MTTVLGVDGCPGGWVVATVGPVGLGWRFAPTAAEVLDLAGDVVAVDIPIGLPERGTRSCDVLARHRLPGRGSSVFPAPVRAVLGSATYAEARRRSVAVDGRSLSAQCFGILPKIAEVDLAVRASSRRTVLEVHPEVSFAALAGRPLARKTSPAGVLARVQLLVAAFGPLPEQVPREARLDDALDALVCAWTALRWLRGEAEVLGGEPDGTGLPMRIVV